MFKRPSVSMMSATAITFGLFTLFVVSGVDKLFHLQGFFNAVRHYVVVPKWAAPMLTILVPLLELWVAVGLAVPAWRKYSTASATGLFMVFMAALLGNYLLGIEAPCGCMFSITLSESTMPHIAFDALLALLSATLLLPGLGWFSAQKETLRGSP